MSFPGFFKKNVHQIKIEFKLAVYIQLVYTLFIRKNLTDLQYKTYGTKKAVIDKQQSIY